jgi:hypothetical protein
MVAYVLLHLVEAAQRLVCACVLWLLFGYVPAAAALFVCLTYAAPLPDFCFILFVKQRSGVEAALRQDPLWVVALRTAAVLAAGVSTA